MAAAQIKQGQRLIVSAVYAEVITAFHTPLNTQFESDWFFQLFALCDVRADILKLVISATQHYNWIPSHLLLKTLCPWGAANQKKSDPNSLFQALDELRGH